MAFEMAIVALQHADRVVSHVMRVAQKITSGAFRAALVGHPT